MYLKIEPSGCVVVPEHPAERAEVGCWVGVMCRFFLEKGDDGYDKYEAEHHVYVPQDWDEYRCWVDSLPKGKDEENIFPNPKDPYDGYPGEREWVFNPFLNHRFYVEPDTTDAEILNIAETMLKESAMRYAAGEEHIIYNVPKQSIKLTTKRLNACEKKVTNLQTASLERKVIAVAEGLGE